MQQDLKVAYILHRYPYLTETFIVREMSSIREQGVDVHIFSLLSPKNTIIHEQAKALLPFTRYSPFISWPVLKAQLHFLALSPSRYFQAFARMIWLTYREPKVLLRALILFPKSVYFAQQMVTLGIDHVHAHFVWLEGIAAGIVTDLVNITFSIHPHAFGLFERNQRNVRCELENATQVITISHYHRDYIATLCPQIAASNIEVVYNGLDTDHFQPAVGQPKGNPVRILSVGRLLEKKGFEYLVDACALLAKRGLDFQCHIVGVGPLKDTLQANINRYDLNDQVRLLGALNQEQVIEQYRQSDIFALACTIARSGDRDGMPTVLTEAMACELPVVTTPVTGIPDLVRDGESGLLVQEREVSELADALEKLITDKALRQRLGKAARQTVLNDFQIQHTTAKLANIFRRVSKQGQELIFNTITIKG